MTKQAKTTRTTTQRSAKPRPGPRGATPATIVEVVEADRVALRFAEGDRTREDHARVALIAGYAPTAGDRVLVAGQVGEAGSELFVIGVIKAARPPVVAGTMQLPDGGTIEVGEGGVELRDRTGRLLVRYADGAAEIAAPSGDLVLGAPGGRVVLRSGTDVAIEAARDVVHGAGRSLEMRVGVGDAAARIAMDPRTVDVRSERVTVEAKSSHATVDEVTTVARAIATRAATIAVSAERYELSATKLVEKARDAFRDVTDLAQSRIGRVRTLVAGAYSQKARRTVIASTDDTSIDGRKIHLG